MTWFTHALSRLSHLPDEVLIFQAKRGSREAFGRLYLKYLDEVYRFIFFRVNQDRFEAEDLTQRVFFKAWSHLATFRHTGTFRAWLYRIAHNEVIDFVRSAKPRVPLREDLADVRPEPTEAVVADEEIVTLYRAMKTLTDEQRQVVTLKYIEGLENQEIAEILGKKVDAVRALQSRALKKLREILKSYE